MQGTIEGRYEMKMVARGTSLPLIRSWVRTHKAGFVIPYSPRQVNNVYLDTPELQMLEDNMSGISERRKVRFRWYGDATSGVEGILEIKRKRNQRSWKISCPVSHRMDFEGELRWADIVAALASDLPVRIITEMNGGWWPVLINHYQREYYVTLGGEVRVTIDYAQTLFDQRRSPYPNIIRPTPCPDTVIVEVKGGASSWELIMEVCSDFPMSVIKNSKYVIGCEAILNY